MAKRFSISIAGWDEYQERPDRANYTWCKLHSKMITGHFWASSTSDQKAVWLTLLCLRNKQQEDIIHTQDFVLAGYCGIKTSEIPKIITGLMGLGVIQDHGGQIPGKFPDVSRQNPGLELEIEIEKEIEKKGAGRPTPPIAPQLEGEYSERALGILEAVSVEAQLSWLAAYPESSWIRQEINKAAAWIAVNPKRAPKKYAPFMGNWLSRGWESFRKTLPANKPEAAIPEWKRQALEEEKRNAG